MFASSITRFQPQGKDAVPSPGDYEIQSSWAAAGAQGAFKSGIDRMKPPKDIVNTPVRADFCFLLHTTLHLDLHSHTAYVAVSAQGPGYYTTKPIDQSPKHVARPDVFFGAVRKPAYTYTGTALQERRPENPSAGACSMSIGTV